MNQTVLIILLIIVIGIGSAQYQLCTELLQSSREKIKFIEKWSGDSYAGLNREFQSLRVSYKKLKGKEIELSQRLERYVVMIEEKDARILELEIKLDSKEQMIFMLNEELKRLMGEQHGETE